MMIGNPRKTTKRQNVISNGNSKQAPQLEEEEQQQGLYGDDGD